MSFPMRNGLGDELVQAGSQEGMRTQNQFLTGSLVVAGAVKTGGALTSTGLVNTGALSSTSNISTAAGYIHTIGSPYGVGTMIPMTARGIISGGMFVAASGGLAFAAPASTKHPIGVAQPGTDVASGGIVNVIIHGVVPVTVEGTIVMGEGAQMGAGAGLNCIAPYVAGSARVFQTLDSASSGTAVKTFIVL